MKNIIASFCALCAILPVLTAQNDGDSLRQTVKTPGFAEQMKDAPDGVSIRMYGDGTFQIFAIGTGSYDFDDPDEIQSAMKEAELKAKAALSKFMSESLSTEEQLDQASKKVKQLTKTNDGTQTNVDRTTVKNTLLSIRNSSSSLLRGVITLSTWKIPASGSAGTCRVLVGVSSKTIVASAGIENQIAAPVSAPVNVAEPVPAANGLPPVPDGWFVCVGQGADREGAVRAALLEGIRQAYGVSLQNDTKLSERVKKLKVNTTATLYASKDVQSTTLSATSGFVREYRIVLVKNLSAALLEATVYANIVNPRAGGVTAVLLCNPRMTPSKAAMNFDAGPDLRISGDELAKRAGTALHRAFTRLNQYLIQTPEELASVMRQRNLSVQMADGGLVPSSELVKGGQLLTADYLLTSEIENFQYTKTLTYDRNANGFRPMQRMSIRINCRMTDTATGNSIMTEELSVTLENNEIAAFQAAEPDSELLVLLMRKVTDILSGKFPKNS